MIEGEEFDSLFLYSFPLSLSLSLKNKGEPTFVNDPKQGKTEAPAPRDFELELELKLKCISPRMHSSFLNRRLILLSVSYRMQFQLGDYRKEGADLKDRIPGRELRNFAASRCQIVPPHPLLQHTLLFFFKCTFRVLQVTSRM